MTKKSSILLSVLIVFLLTIAGMTANAVGSNSQGNGHDGNGPPETVNVNLSVGGDTYGRTGDNVTVYVNITNNTENISKLRFDLLYDDNVLSVINVTNGSVVLSDFHTDIKNGDIRIEIGPPDKDNVNPFEILRISGNGTVAIINFTVIGANGSSSSLEIDGKSKEVKSKGDIVKIRLSTTDSVFYVDNKLPELPESTPSISPTATVTETIGEPEEEEDAPEIIDFDPGTEWVHDDVGATRTYSIKIDQTVDVKWYVRPIDADMDDKYIVDEDKDVKHSSYTDTNAKEGIWRVTAVVHNENGGDSHIWKWNVTSPISTPSGTATTEPTTTSTVTPTSTATTEVPTETQTPTETETPTTTTTITIPETPVPTATITPTSPTPTATITPTSPTPTETPTGPTPTETPTGPTPTVPPVSGIRGGGGEGFDNSKIIGEPDIFEEVEKDLRVGIPTTYSFDAFDFAIYQIVVVSKESEYNVGIRVTKIKDRSKFTNTDAPEIVYTNESITSETQRLSNVLIRFRVNNSWVDNNGDIQLYELVNGSWESLETSMKNKDNNYTYFESNNSGIARWQLFAISGGTRSPSPVVTQVVTPTITSSPVTVKAQVGGSIPWLVILLVLLGLVAGTTYYRDRNKQKNGEDKEKKE